MINSLKNQLLAEKRVFDIMKMKYLTPDDKKVINYVANKIAMIKTGAILVRDTISISEAFVKSLNSLRIFGESCYTDSLKFAGVRFVPVFPDSYSYSCFVSFDVDDKTIKPNKDSGKVDHFKIPNIIDTKSEIFLGHELIHALKETNYEEYILVSLVSDVIPIFYELIGSDMNEKVKKDIINFRMAMLKTERDTYNNATNNMKKSRHEKDLYKVLQNRSGQYLNSFYYALILYNMYKKDSEGIIQVINRVLSREITTLDMLIELGIYNVDNNVVFDTELEEVKKILK